MEAEWGSVPLSNAPTQCVKKFRSPRSRQPFSRRGEQITSLQFGTANSRELLCSWSFDDVYLFDIQGCTEGKKRITIASKTGIKDSFVLLKPRRPRPPKRTLDIAKDSDSYELLRVVKDYLSQPPFFGRNYKATLLKFQKALTCASAGHAVGHGLDTIRYPVACHHLLLVLAQDNTPVPEQMMVAPANEPWACEAIRVIAFACLSRSLDPADYAPIPELRGFLDGPVIDVTSFNIAEQQLFSSYSAMISYFNTITATSDSLEKTFQTERCLDFGWNRCVESYSELVNMISTRSSISQPILQIPIRK